jgi:hypothetical protein
MIVPFSFHVLRHGIRLSRLVRGRQQTLKLEKRLAKDGKLSVYIWQPVCVQVLLVTLRRATTCSSPQTEKIGS